MHTNNASSLGIIGGADGPTSIFISGNPGWAVMKGVFALLFIGVVVFVIKKKSRQS